MYLENKGWTPTDREWLLTEVRNRMPESVRVIDLRIGSSHIELDIVTDVRGAEDIKRYVEKFQRVIDLREIVKSEETRKPEVVMREAAQLFNRERFWEAHEVLEGLWRRLTGVEKNVVHGLILLAAAYVHLQKDELEVFRSILARARNALEEHDVVEIFGLNVDVLRRRLDKADNSTEIVKLNIADNRDRPVSKTK
jgi:predicted metal-dependent hydrolase